MATRGIFLVQHNNDYKISYLFHYDAYYSNIGCKLLEYLKDENFINVLKNYEYLDSQTVYDLNIHNFEKQLETNTIFEYYDYNRLLYSSDYGYVVDLDTNRFEIYYKNFNTPLTKYERFTGEKSFSYPLTLINVYELHKLPIINDFKKTCLYYINESTNGNFYHMFIDRRIKSIEEFMIHNQE